MTDLAVLSRRATVDVQVDIAFTTILTATEVQTAIIKVFGIGSHSLGVDAA